MNVMHSRESMKDVPCLSRPPTCQNAKRAKLFKLEDVYKHCCSQFSNGEQGFRERVTQYAFNRKIQANRMNSYESMVLYNKHVEKQQIECKKKAAINMLFLGRYHFLQIHKLFPVLIGEEQSSHASSGVCSSAVSQKKEDTPHWEARWNLLYGIWRATKVVNMGWKDAYPRLRENVWLMIAMQFILYPLTHTMLKKEVHDIQMCVHEFVMRLFYTFKSRFMIGFARKVLGERYSAHQKNGAPTHQHLVCGHDDCGFHGSIRLYHVANGTGSDECRQVQAGSSVPQKKTPDLNLPSCVCNIQCSSGRKEHCESSLNGGDKHQQQQQQQSAIDSSSSCEPSSSSTLRFMKYDEYITKETNLEVYIPICNCIERNKVNVKAEKRLECLNYVPCASLYAYEDVLEAFADGKQLYSMHEHVKDAMLRSFNHFYFHAHSNNNGENAWEFLKGACSSTSGTSQPFFQAIYNRMVFTQDRSSSKKQSVQSEVSIGQVDVISSNTGDTKEEIYVDALDELWVPKTPMDVERQSYMDGMQMLEPEDFL